jgi:hypothetical protein
MDAGGYGPQSGFWLNEECYLQTCCPDLFFSSHVGVYRSQGSMVTYQQTKIEMPDIFPYDAALRIILRMIPMTYPIDHTPPGFGLFFVLFDWLGVFDMKGLSFEFPSR